MVTRLSHLSLSSIEAPQQPVCQFPSWICLYREVQTLNGQILDAILQQQHTESLPGGTAARIRSQQHRKIGSCL
ncbi:MAG: hypothetical protein COB10_09515 [Planctomycetota bacterium]|nr:MAG: hypothetical protein COB10_09515 [Planctomycetota bacterium]